MKTLIKAILICKICALTSVYATTWQTTHGGSSGGDCGLISNKLSITVHPYFADVVEEAQISTLGEVWSGDAATLEITGTFVLQEGSAIRSMLVWEGDKILKAKLLIRADADSAYEDIVDRDKIVYVPHDPAIIQYMGNDQYQFKIYPVAIGESRKIRIRYTVPMNIINNKPIFKIIPAFTLGARDNPTQIPVEINKYGEMFDECIIAYGNVKKSAVFNSSYAVPYSTFTSYYDYTVRSYRYGSITLSPILKENSYWIHSVIDTGTAKGNYYAIFAIIPDTVNALLKENSYDKKSITIECNLTIGGKTYLSDVPNNGSICAYIKSDSSWDTTLKWVCYDNTSGKKLFECKYKFGAMLDTVYNTDIPLLWGAKHTLKEKMSSLGAIFGFVDNQMSLLARENDTLPRSLREEYKDGGVPLLAENEIIIKPDKRPVPPSESVIFEIGTAVRCALAEIPDFTLSFANNILSLQFSGNIDRKFSAILFDASGRVVEKFDNIGISTSCAQLRLKPCLKGTFILRIVSGNKEISKRLVLM